MFARLGSTFDCRVIMILGQKTSRNNSHCKLNLRMDGVNDGTSFVDSSPSGKTVTRSGALTKTAVKKFGTASGYFDGTNDFLSLVDSDDWFWGTGDFTVEFWGHFPTIPPTIQMICNQYEDADNSNGFYMATYLSDILIRQRSRIAGNSTFGVTSDSTPTAAIPQNTWVHLCTSRKSGTVKFFIGGILYSTETGFLLSNLAAVLYIGAQEATSSYYLEGYLDGFLWTKGKAIYTRNFTPPNRAA